jgi:hypothetical protein
LARSRNGCIERRYGVENGWGDCSILKGGLTPTAVKQWGENLEGDSHYALPNYSDGGQAPQKEATT